MEGTGKFCLLSRWWEGRHSLFSSCALGDGEDFFEDTLAPAVQKSEFSDLCPSKILKILPAAHKTILAPSAPKMVFPYLAPRKIFHGYGPVCCFLKFCVSPSPSPSEIHIWICP